MTQVILIGFLAGVLAGLVGVGGGVLFVAGLVAFEDLDLVAAEGTSLLAIIPVALVGAWRQQRYGNVRIRDAALVGVLATGGAAIGVVLANAVPERTLELLFAGFTLLTAAMVVRRARREPQARSAQ